jgi:hypothetical protein
MTQYLFDNPVLDPFLPGSALGRLMRLGGVRDATFWWPSAEQLLTSEFAGRKLVVRQSGDRSYVQHVKAARTLRDLGFRDCWWATRQLDERLSRSVNFWCAVWPPLLSLSHKVVMTGPPEVLEQFRTFAQISIPSWRAQINECELVLQNALLTRFRVENKLIDFPGAAV